MMSRIYIKRAIKRAAGWAAAALDQCFIPNDQPLACILTYHRTASLRFIDPQCDDWNVPPETLEEQIAAVHDIANIVPLAELPALLSAGKPRFKPFVSLTFDDGYASFYTNALPVLKEYGVSATVFVVTSVVGWSQPMPFDSWSRKNGARLALEASRSMNWSELEQCVKTGLVTVGSHSHTHCDGRNCSPAQLVDEAERSRAELVAHLGAQHCRAYSYPYGSVRLGEVPPEYVRAVRQAGYQLAVTTDLGLVHPDADSFLLPRMEAHAVDTASIIRAKVYGRLAPYRITDRLRSARRQGKQPVSLQS